MKGIDTIEVLSAGVFSKDVNSNKTELFVMLENFDYVDPLHGLNKETV